MPSSKRQCVPLALTVAIKQQQQQQTSEQGHEWSQIYSNAAQNLALAQSTG